VTWTKEVHGAHTHSQTVTVCVCVYNIVLFKFLCIFMTKFGFSTFNWYTTTGGSETEKCLLGAKYLHECLQVLEDSRVAGVMNC